MRVGLGVLLFEKAYFKPWCTIVFGHYFSGIHLLNCMVFVFALLKLYDACCFFPVLRLFIF